MKRPPSWLTAALTAMAMTAGAGVCDRGGTTREAIEQAGAWVRPLPPYSPDFNPIESMESKVKQFLRSAAART